MFDNSARLVVHSKTEVCILFCMITKANEEETAGQGAIEESHRRDVKHCSKFSCLIITPTKV